MYDLYRIISGVIRTKDLVVKAPVLRILVEAEELYNEIYSRNYADGVITKNQLKKLIIDQGVLPANYEEQLTILRNKIEDFKVDYYEDYINPKSREKNLKNIKDVEFSVMSILSAFSRFGQLTCSSIADTAKSVYILEHSTFDLNDNPYNWKQISINNLQNYVSKITLDDDEVREMALLPEWRMMWGIRSECPVFNQMGFELTSEQKSLISWSKFYDSIFESPEKPSDEIIQDPYAIDGWSISKRREYESSAKEAQDSQRYGDAQEIFKKAITNEEARAVRNMNSPQSKAIQDKRFSNLK